MIQQTRGEGHEIENVTRVRGRQDGNRPHTHEALLLLRII